MSFGFFDQFLDDEDEEEDDIDFEIGNPFDFQLNNFANGGGMGLINPFEF